MKNFTRRAFISSISCAALTGFNSSPANAQASTTGSLIRVLNKSLPDPKQTWIKISKWAWDYLKDDLLSQLTELALRYVIEHVSKFVNVVITATQQELQKIKAKLKGTVDDHLLQIAESALAAGVIITIAISGPFSPLIVAPELVAEALILPFLLIAYHQDLLNFVAGKAYEIV
jgi:hypothetical protein